jgi:nickel-type superoxide dismutase maturation protease
MVHRQLNLPEQGAECTAEYPVLARLSGWHFCRWMCGRLIRRKVTGNSMLPTFTAGSEVLIERSKSGRHNLCVGDIIYCQHPFNTNLQLIKRIQRIDTNRNAVFAVGDNPNSSTDSRTLGLIPKKNILGKIICVFAT